MSTDNPTAIRTTGRREVFAWSMYDFANSGYTTVVMTTIYSAFFVGVIAAGLDDAAPGTATFLWTAAIAMANIIVLVSAPVIGAIADHRASKKQFLLFSTIGCAAATAALSIAAPGQVALAMGLLVASAVCFAAGENLIAAFLPEIADNDSMGRISGYGWSLGYFGGLLTLGSCLAYVNWADSAGQAAADYVPVTLLITAVIFAVAATPTFLWLRERPGSRERLGAGEYVHRGFQQVKSTLVHAAHYHDLFRFLACLTLYQSGVATVVVVAAVYAQEVMGFDSQQLIILIMVVNLTAAIGAFAFGFAQDRFGSIPTLALGLLVWIAAIAVTFFASEASHVWLAGNLMGLAMGATQAGGRALIGQFTPEARNGEFFGLWGLACRAAAVIGPISYGVIGKISGGDHRLAILSTATFFVLGLFLLLSVNENRGRTAASVEPGV